MKNRVQIFRWIPAALLVAATMASCVRDKVIGPEPVRPGDGATVFTVSVPAPDLVGTRAIVEESLADNAVNDLVLLFFGTDGMYAGFAEAEIVDRDDENSELYTVRAYVPPGSHTALAVANWGALKGVDLEQHLNNNLNLLTAKTIEEVASGNLFRYGAYPDGEDFTADRQYFVMGGRWTFPVTGSNPLPLTRSLAKINVTVGGGAGLTTSGESPTPGAGFTTFNMKQIVLLNANGEALTLPAASSTALNIPADAEPVADTGISYAVPTAAQSFTDAIFLPETAAPEDADNFGGTSWQDAVALLIEADLHDTDADLMGRWFRVNLRRNDDKGTADPDDDELKHIDILRNHKYIVNIVKVNNIGYDSADEILDNDVLPGDLIVDLEVHDDHDLNDIVYSGQYYLAAGRLETFRSWESDRADGYELVQNLKVYTNYPGGWKIENIVYPGLHNLAGTPFSQSRYSDKLDWYQDWLTVDESSGPQGLGAIRVRVKPCPAPTHSLRPAEFDVVAGNLRLTVKAEQHGGGFLASPGVLGVGVESGKLTLRGSKEYAGTPVAAASEFGALADETVYVAYFKWGSLIASTSAGGHEKLYTPDDLVWAPAGFRGTATEAEALAAVKAEATLWLKGVPYQSQNYFWTSDLTNGLGDPCAYAESGIDGSKWRLPVGGTANGGWNGGSFGASANQQLANYWVNWGVAGHGKAGLPAGAVKGGPGDPDWSMFLPFTGGRHRNSINGNPDEWGEGDQFDGRLHNSDNHNQAIWGRYWSGTPRSVQHGEYINFNTGTDAAVPNRMHSADQQTGMFNWEGLAIRCVPWEPTLDLEPASLTFDWKAIGAGDAKTLTVTANGPWEVTNPDPTNFTVTVTTPGTAENNWGGTITVVPKTLNTSFTETRSIAVEVKSTTESAVRYEAAVAQTPEPAKVFAAPGMVGIRRNDYYRLVTHRATTNDPDALLSDIEPTIKGSSTYSTTNQGGVSYVQTIAENKVDGLEDDPVYALLFKWGSMVAMIGGESDTWSVDDVVWVNPGFTRTIGAYASFTPASYINYGVGGGRNDVIESISDGHGDPCKWVDGANGDGDWRTPTGVPYTTTDTYNKFDGTGGTNTPFGTSTVGSPRIGWGDARNATNKAVTYWNSSTGSTPSQATLGFTRASAVTTGVYPNGAAVSDNRDLFLPAAGYRGDIFGSVNNQGLNGGYWTSTAYNNDNLGGGLFFDNVGVFSSNNGKNHNGFAVRCVQTPPEPELPVGVLAAPGVIGYIADGPRRGELTLRGSKEYANNTAIRDAAITMFPATDDEPAGVSTQTVYVAYFKFGSLVAIGSGGGDNDTFDKDDIIAVPEAYYADIEAYKTYVDGGATAQDKWVRIDDAGDGVTLSEGQNIGTDLTKGLGDPCAYWFDGVYDNNWRLPLGGASNRTNTPVDGWNGGTFGTATYNNPSSNHNSTWYATGAVGADIPAGRRGSAGWEWYLPHGGYRDEEGNAGLQYANGMYWTSTTVSSERGYSLNIHRTDVYPSYGYSTFGFAVRCVKELAE